MFDVQAGSGTAVKTKFNDVIIEGNTIPGLLVRRDRLQAARRQRPLGDPQLHERSTWTPHTNVVVRGNYLSQLNTRYGCNTIYMTNVQNGSSRTTSPTAPGTSAIELYYTDNVTVQKNETFGTKVKANGADSNGIDTDKATTKTVIQYNYIHDNGDGILICQFSFGDSIVRYNIMQNNSRYQIYLHSDKAAVERHLQQHRLQQQDQLGRRLWLRQLPRLRRICCGTTSSSRRAGTASSTGTGAAINEQPLLRLDHPGPGGRHHAIRADPKLAAPGTGTSGAPPAPRSGPSTATSSAPGRPPSTPGSHQQ